MYDVIKSGTEFSNSYVRHIYYVGVHRSQNLRVQQYNVKCSLCIIFSIFQHNLVAH